MPQNNNGKYRYTKGNSLLENLTKKTDQKKEIIRLIKVGAMPFYLLDIFSIHLTYSLMKMANERDWFQV